MNNHSQQIQSAMSTPHESTHHDAPPALTIAGIDPSGGAGLAADLKTFAAHGTYGMSVLTVATDCTTEGVTDVHALPPAFVRRQLERVVDDIPPAAVKTGMLFNTAIIETVAQAAADLDLMPLVIDPVMTTRRGEPLLSEDAEAALRTLIGKATVTTPSLPEAERLVGASIQSRADTEAAARAIHDRLHPAHVVITGGHASDETAADCWYNGDTIQWLEADRQPYAVHGGGDTFSAALTAGLAQNLEVEAALRRAKRFVTRAIRQAPPRGAGHRPLALDGRTHAFASPNE